MMALNSMMISPKNAVWDFSIYKQHECMHLPAKKVDKYYRSSPLLSLHTGSRKTLSTAVSPMLKSHLFVKNWKDV